MSLEGTLHAEHIWKRFRADRQRLLLRDQFERLIGRADGRRRWRWALRDITLIAEPGESVGIVGSNGSGKTTLLKVLAQVMYPYAGRIAVHGRIGALIEVRAGIHPDLTGRENIALQGSLLGMRRKEVMKRFDEIVSFAELEDAIDRQVKFYSTGMQTRLGFAIAAFLEPHTLLVDEVLAVGDANFQQRCLDRMRDVLGAGTTVVFVSHDLAAVEALCARTIWLRHGAVEGDGPSREILGEYRRLIEEASEYMVEGEGVVRLVKTEIVPVEDQLVRTHGDVDMRVVLNSPEPWIGKFYLGVSEGPATPVFVLKRDLPLTSGDTEIRCRISGLPLPRGRYYVWVGHFDNAGNELLAWHPCAHFDVAGPDLDPAPVAVVRLAPVHVEAAWDVSTR
jgi:ABC-type polysaccharide/polyol phosphate transport system ATPase subunit